ncbi:MAG: hypothetical protein NTZ16_10095 [Verrucomicrobia bacterium]|nr:hypothetical protein [Verrucomicrobiota bacterium]
MKTDDKHEQAPPLKGWWLAAGGCGRRAGYAVLVSVDQPGLRPLPPGKDRMIAAALDNLARVLGEDCAWMLTGGLSIAAAMGRFYRDHDDFDIAVHQDELARLVAVAESHGYGFFCRLGATRISPTRRVTLYRRMAPEQAARNWHRRFRLLRVGTGGWRMAPLALSDFVQRVGYAGAGGWPQGGILHNDFRSQGAVARRGLYGANQAAALGGKGSVRSGHDAAAGLDRLIPVRLGSGTVFGTDGQLSFCFRAASRNLSGTGMPAFSKSFTAQSGQ